MNVPGLPVPPPSPDLNAEQPPAAPTRVGVIGAGWFASRRHLPDLQKHPDAALSAICRRDAEARQQVADHFHLAPNQCFEDWQMMLAEASLDAVLIATPNNLHYAQARACLERGLHVLLEKPMTIRAEEAHTLVQIAAERRLHLAVALNPPYWAHCHAIRRALRDPRLGQLESVALYWTGQSGYAFGRAPRPDNLPGVVPPTMFRADPDQNGGGYFIDGGSHLVSTLLWTTGLRARRVSAMMDSVPSDMRTALTLELENGAMASIVSLGDSAFATRRVRNVWGATGGTITVSGFDFDTTVALHGQETRKFKEADLLPVAGPVANWVETIQSKAGLFGTGAHGAHVVEVVEAAYQSAQTGCVVALPEPQGQSAPGQS